MDTIADLWFGLVGRWQEAEEALGWKVAVAVPAAANAWMLAAVLGAVPNGSLHVAALLLVSTTNCLWFAYQHRVYDLSKSRRAVQDSLRLWMPSDLSAMLFIFFSPLQVLIEWMVMDAFEPKGAFYLLFVSAMCPAILFVVEKRRREREEALHILQEAVAEIESSARMAAGYRLPEDQFFSSYHGEPRLAHTAALDERTKTQPNDAYRIPSTSSFTSVAAASPSRLPEQSYTPEAYGAYPGYPEAASSGAYPGYPSVAAPEHRPSPPTRQRRDVPMPSEADLNLFEELKEEPVSSAVTPVEEASKPRKKRRSSTSNPFQRARRKSNR